jgi:hypothetical protein
MSALTVTPPNTTTFQPSPELWRLLATGPKENLAEIAQVPALKAEAASCQRQLEILCEPAGAQVVIGALAPLVIVFGKGAEAESTAFWRVYTDALGDLPRIALDRAVSEYQRTGRFFPKPAEIRDLARPHAEVLRQAAYRAKQAADYQPEQRLSDADRLPAEKVQALMADFAKRMEGKDVLERTRNRKVRPAPCARVDETGMSAEARALLERQGTIKPKPAHQDQAA